MEIESSLSEDQCELVTDGFAKLIQLSLGFISIGTLYIKREMEYPKRSFEIWSLDVSKQGMGALMVHTLNIILSMLFASQEGHITDECGLYFITFVIDVSLGTFVMIQFIKWFESSAKYFKWNSFIETGNYGHPPNYVIWAKQLISWLFLLIVMKIAVTFVIWCFFYYISKMATYTFSIFSQHRHLELFIVMILGPCLLNSIQFWVLDSAIKIKEKNGFSSVPTEGYVGLDKEERLVHNSS